MKHQTVLKHEAVSYLSIKTGGIYIDSTFGAGGHSREILSQNCNITLFCIDRDPSTMQYFSQLQNDFPRADLHFINQKFSTGILEISSKIGANADGVLFDLGVSSMQLDDAHRGFSFRQDSELSMQMGINSISAFDVVNSFSEEELANLIYKYGDERKSRRVAKSIIESRKIKEISTTLELAEIVKKSVGRYNDTIHPATRTFQAIRIYVNDELEDVEKALENINKVCKIGARVVFISFHSLEDEIIKRFIKNHDPEKQNLVEYDRNYGIITKNIIKTKGIAVKAAHKGVITPSEEEIRHNVRSRSAKMRCFEIVKEQLE